MESLRLKKRLELARRGHKLLKNKQDELINQFEKIMEESKKIRKELLEKLRRAYRTLIYARGSQDKQRFISALALHRQKYELKISEKKFMNLKLPEFKFNNITEQPSHTFFHDSTELNIAVKHFQELLSELIKLAEAEKAITLIGLELQKTRRRVNALEYILIPSLEETIKDISEKLAEMERANISRLMKIKQMG
jgi:V/A-type H+-transporting ATPase subunit D